MKIDEYIQKLEQQKADLNEKLVLSYCVKNSFPDCRMINEKFYGDKSVWTKLTEPELFHSNPDSYGYCPYRYQIYITGKIEYQDFTLFPYPENFWVGTYQNDEEKTFEEWSEWEDLAIKYGCTSEFIQKVKDRLREGNLLYG